MDVEAIDVGDISDQIVIGKDQAGYYGWGTGVTDYNAQNKVDIAHGHGDGGQKCCESDDCKGAAPSNTQGGENMVSIFDVIRLGLLIPVQTIVETFGAEILSSRDEKGATPAHWACLHGQKIILQYIVSVKGPFDEPGRDDVGQRPIHWACINGHIAIVDQLLRFGVSIDVTDNKGCTPLIVASQYGHTMLVGYLIGKGAQLFYTDKEGDTALHWAAFKGHHELMRLLIYSGFNPHQQDNYGQTPLHLSCISGNLTAVKELCEQDHCEINLMDKKGKTPLALAMGRNHNKIVAFLKKETRRRTSILPQLDGWSLVFGPPGNNKAPLLFLIFSILLWGYPSYIIKCIPVLWNGYEVLHIIFIGVNVIMWIALYCVSTMDPGFIPKNMPEYDESLKQVTLYEEWRQGINPLSRLCHTCRCVKPMRSKHCRICNRCVRTMDHHCPYIYNCVGFNNRGWFFLFVVSAFVLFAITDYLCLMMLITVGWDWVLILGGLQAGFFTVVCSFVFVFTLYHMKLNLTTNERVNCTRYKYLQDIKGRYYNPYDRGLRRNVQEFFHMQRPLTDEEVEFLNVTVI